MPELGTIIREVRRLRNMTQSQVGLLADLSVNFLSQVECGRKCILPATLAQVAQALTVPVSFFYVLAEEPTTPLLQTLQDSLWTVLRSPHPDTYTLLLGRLGEGAKTVRRGRTR